MAGFAVLDNHLHVVLLLNDSVANGWTDEEVVRRWGRLFPPRGKDRQALEVTDVWVEFQLKNVKWVEETRRRLNSLGWFMKCLKEPLSRMANREDKCKGTFFESRFKSIAILDEEALLTTLAYVDLNPLAAGMAKTPEDSLHTSVKARVDHCREQETLDVVGASDALADVANSSDDKAPSSGLRPPSPPARGRRDSAESLIRPTASVGNSTCRRGKYWGQPSIGSTIGNVSVLCDPGRSTNPQRFRKAQRVGHALVEHIRRQPNHGIPRCSLVVTTDF